jgi:hypothetical protein
MNAGATAVLPLMVVELGVPLTVVLIKWTC